MKDPMNRNVREPAESVTNNDEANLSQIDICQIPMLKTPANLKTHITSALFAPESLQTLASAMNNPADVGPL